MSIAEKRVLFETRLRNLKRKHAKLSQHAELAEEYFEIGKEIEEVEAQIAKLQ